MRIAFVGKGGSGKTTLSSLLCRYLAAQRVPILAIDADINQHLGRALGLSEAEAATVPALGSEIDRLKEYLRGSNPRIASSAVMTKTTPPGRGSRLLRLVEENPLSAYFERHVEGIRLLATGPLSQDDLGLHCYHAKVGAIELILNHMLDKEGEYIVVDMTAGADSFASGLFTKFDLTFLVVEPTLKAVGVYQQYKAYANDYAVAIKVIGNKVESAEDLAFLQEQVGDDLLTHVAQSPFVRAMEKGKHLPLSQLEPEQRHALATMQQAVDACEKDWDKLYRQAIAFHRMNAVSWANAATGEDVTRQIDPDYILAEQVQQRRVVSASASRPVTHTQNLIKK